MKLSSKLLIAVFLILIMGLVASNLLLKKQFDNPETENEFPGYRTLNTQGFKHLNIHTGNAGKIIYEPSNKPRFMVGTYLNDSMLNLMKNKVSNDTLYIEFPKGLVEYLYEKGWREYNVPIRLFSPELLSIQVNDSYLELHKMRQSVYQISLHGKSELKMETKLSNLKDLNLSLADSSLVWINYDMEERAYAKTPVSIENCKAILSGVSHLNMANSRVNQLQLNANEESSVDLTGYNLKKLISEGQH